MALYAGLRRNDIDFSAIPESGASEMALQFVVALLKKEQAERPSVHDALALDWIVNGLKATETQDLRHLSGKKYRNAFNRMGHKSAFSKVVSMCSASQLDTARVHDLNKAFKAIDANGDGVLSPKEL